MTCDAFSMENYKCRRYPSFGVSAAFLWEKWMAALCKKWMAFYVRNGWRLCKKWMALFLGNERREWCGHLTHPLTCDNGYALVLQGRDAVPC
jgi:hypothetical protein